MVRLAGCETSMQVSDSQRAERGAPALDRSSPTNSKGRYDVLRVSTLHYILKHLDEELVENMMAAWMAEQVPGGEPLALPWGDAPGPRDRTHPTRARCSV